jgi:PAS domain S-box-containing protein
MKEESRNSMDGEQLDQLFFTAPIGFCLVDLELRFVRVNQRFAARTGLPAAEHAGLSLAEVIPDLAFELEASCRKVIETGEAMLDLVVHGTTPVKPVVSRYWLVHYHPLRSGDGAVTGVSLIVQDITERRLAEQRLMDEKRFEELISSISGDLVDLPVEDVDEAIVHSLEALGRFFDADRVSLSRVDSKEKKYEVTHLWLADPFDPEDDLTVKQAFALPRATAHLEREGFFVFEKPGDLPEDWTRERELVEVVGARAGVAVSLSVEEHFMGAILVTSLTHERIWPANLVQRLKFAGEIFAKALMHKEASESLQKAYNEIEKLTEQLEAENTYLREEIKTVHSHGEIVGSSPAIKRVLHQVEQVAGTDSTVLLLGETGTGKELLARAIHNLSRRKDRTMVMVNCAAMPATLVESELFGREKGAYTGALTKQAGRFEAADNSTLFLDEIGELSAEVQAKLLRVLQEGQIERLGSPDTIDVDVRVIAATHRDLPRMVQDGEFREDLYYRFNVFPIPIPPLRERREDIPALVWTFVKEFGKKMGKRVEKIQKKSMESLERYPWPGNIRELRNAIERAMILCNDLTLRIEIPQTPVTGSAPASMTLEELERKHILDVMEMTEWRVRGERGAAQILGLKPTTLEARMRKLGIKRNA